ncbi:MAG TPA: PAS domain-containing sensor histidine kinase [Aggregatilineales bacterium]|nr:PAS domain-containing sensor histidine kinase [Aggregatilineales bacterium]
MSAVEIILLMLLVLAGLAIAILIGDNRFLRNRSNDLWTERRNLQQALDSTRINETWLNTLADTTFDALMVVDADKRVLKINRTAQELFHASPDHSLTLMTVTRQHELDEMLDDVLKSGESLESQIEVKDHTFRVRSAIISRPNEKSLVVLAMQDITELIRATRARRDMVANFSHDLRTPISSIRLLVESLMMRYGKNPQRDLETIGKLASQADNLTHMTRELIDLSMIESGQAIVRMVPVEFPEIVALALSVMSTQLDEKHLTVTNEIPGSLRVLADPEATKRVLTNIIHNAVKFTPNGGTIQLSATCDPQMVTICVRDTGPGIPPQDRARIFERFYQVDNSRTGQSTGGGSGLGLSIARHIVEAQGGRIWAEAAIPQGACLCFTMALAEPEKEKVSDDSRRA